MSEFPSNPSSRLQPLVDDDTVENIIITGADNVWVEKVDGTLLRVGPVADSDQELLDYLSARRRGGASHE